MSKVGRKPIDLGKVKVELLDKEIAFSGPLFSGSHVLPDVLSARIEDNRLFIVPAQDVKIVNDVNRLWGLHRALVHNKIYGAEKPFTKELIINGLGYKGVLSGEKIVFSLGYSHKIDFPLPKGISVEIDKSGQNLKVVGSDKEQVGAVCSKIRALREPEPYKGTGIKYANEEILRKAGKTKS